LFTKKGALGKVVNKAIESYQLGDNLWKLFGYNYVKSQLKPALKNLDEVKDYFRDVYKYEFKPVRADGTKKTLDDALKEIAGIEIRDTYPNYSMIPTIVQNVRKFPLLGNFVAFMSEMYRNSFQIVRGALRKMQSQNPYIRQIGARQLIGFTTTVGIATPVAMESAHKMTGITKEMYQAYKDRFAPEYEKASEVMPVTEQQEDRSWKASNLSYLLPYDAVTAPFKAAMQTLAEGRDTDEGVVKLYTSALNSFFQKAVEPFIQPSIAFETSQELIPNNDGQFRTKAGGLIADIKNDPDWINKVMYHIYKKVTPTTIRSAEEIGQAIGKDLSKSGVQRDLWDTVVKIMTGFSVTKQDPYQSMRFKVGGYAGDMQNARQAFTNDIISAKNLQSDMRLLSRGLPGETFTREYEKLQSNNYRILSEAYKDIQALRTLNFTDKEIRDLISGRRAFSKRDVNMLMLGTFVPENVPNFKKDSAVANAVKNINRELDTNYTINDFINRPELFQIRNKYMNIPLGLNETDREEFLRSTIDRKIETMEPKIEENIKRIDDQQSFKPPAPASNFLPDPQIANMFAQNVDPTTNLTRTETALLSPEEQLIRQRLRT
jgi:hypothetical protein